MFKNLMLFRIAPSWTATVDDIDRALSAGRFAPCAASEAQSIGWAEPRGIANGPLAEAVSGQYLLRLMIDEKILPASVVKRKVEETAAKIEQDTGLKPGRKFLKEIKEDVIQKLLPVAFTKQTAVDVWIAPETRLLAIDATSKVRAGQVITALVNSLGGFAVSDLLTRQSPAGAMAAWLLEDKAPAGFTVDMDAALQADDDMRTSVRYGRAPLDTEEVRHHIREGLLPKSLALTYDSRVSFVLTDTLQLKRIQFLDVVFEGNSNDSDDGFDADAAIATGELAPLISGLIAALGGEQAPLL